MLRNLNLRILWALLALVSWTGFTGQLVYGSAAAAGGGGGAAAAVGLDRQGRLTRVSAIKILPYDPWDGITAKQDDLTGATEVAGEAALVPPKHLGSRDTGADGVVAANGHIAFGEYKDPFGFDPVDKFTRVDGALQVELGKPQNARYMSADEIGKDQFDWGDWALVDGNWVPATTEFASVGSASAAASSSSSSSSAPSFGEEAGSPRRPTYTGYKPGTHGDYLQRLVKYKRDVDPVKLDVDPVKVRDKGSNLLLVRVDLELQKFVPPPSDAATDAEYATEGETFTHRIFFGVFSSSYSASFKPYKDSEFDSKLLCKAAKEMYEDGEKAKTGPREDPSPSIKILTKGDSFSEQFKRFVYASKEDFRKSTFASRVGDFVLSNKDQVFKLDEEGTTLAPYSALDSGIDVSRDATSGGFRKGMKVLKLRFGHIFSGVSEKPKYEEIEARREQMWKFFSMVYGPTQISRSLVYHHEIDLMGGSVLEGALRKIFYQSEQVFINKIFSVDNLEPYLFSAKALDGGSYNIVSSRVYLYSTFDVCKYCRGTLASLEKKNNFILKKIVLAINRRDRREGGILPSVYIANNRYLPNSEIFAFSCYDTDT